MSYKTDLQTKSKEKERKKDKKKRKLMNILSLSNSICNSIGIFNVNKNIRLDKINYFNMSTDFLA